MKFRRLLFIYCFSVFNLFALENLPFELFQLEKPESSLKPSIGSDYYIYNSYLIFQDYRINYEYCEYFDSKKQSFYYLSTDDCDINVFKLFLRTMVSEYSSLSDYISTSFYIVEDENIIEKKLYFHKDGRKPILLYVKEKNNSTVGFGIVHSSNVLFSKTAFLGNLYDHINMRENYIYPVESFTFDKYFGSDSFSYSEFIHYYIKFTETSGDRIVKFSEDDQYEELGKSYMTIRKALLLPANRKLKFIFSPEVQLDNVIVIIDRDSFYTGRQISGMDIEIKYKELSFFVIEVFYILDAKILNNAFLTIQ